jgi:hypothetical protein
MALEMFYRLNFLLLLAITFLGLTPRVAIGFEWIEYSSALGERNFYNSDIKSWKVHYNPEFSDGIYLGTKNDYDEYHDGLTFSVMSSFDDYKMGGGEQNLLNLSGEKFRYNAAITGFVVSCVKLQMSDGGTRYYQTTNPTTLSFDDKSFLGESTTIPSDELFFSPAAFGIFPRLYDLPSESLKETIQKLCSDFYPNGAKKTVSGVKPRRPKNMRDMIGIGFHSGRNFKLFWDHALIEVDDKALVRFLHKNKKNGFWYVSKYKNNTSDYRYDDAFKIVEGELKHWEYSWGIDEFVENDSFKSLEPFDYSRLNGASKNLDIKDFDRIKLASEKGITLKFVQKDGKCIATGSEIKTENADCRISGNSLFVGPFEHVDSGNQVEWEITAADHDSHYVAKVVGEVDTFASLHRLYSFRKMQPPFLQKITDLLTNDIVNGYQTIISFSGTAEACKAESELIRDTQAFCEFKNNSVLVGPFFHRDSEEKIELNWMFKLNDLGGVEAFVKSKYTKDWPGGWRGFGDYTVEPKKY